MLGACLQFGRSEDRFYNAMRSCRNHQNQQLQRHQNYAVSSAASMLKGKMVAVDNQEAETTSSTAEDLKPAALPPSTLENPPCSNLDRFLESTTPSVVAQYPSKTRMRKLKASDDVEFHPYFTLGNLWESYKEWSAYGAGVPLILNGSDGVVQYYVPYLSAIQIFGKSAKPPVKSRRLGEESDGDDSRDSSSDMGSDCELEMGLKHTWDLESESGLRIDRLSLREDHVASQGGFSSDDSESENSRGHLLYEYFERDLPYSREPLADKIGDLSRGFPGLKTLSSCDLLPTSWMSVAWYPIYRIPTGPTLRDLDACFLTFHSLSTPMSDAGSVNGPTVSYPDGVDGVPRISLPVFGLASYKFKSSMWTLNGGSEHQLSSLLQAASSWLRLLQVNHPDFQFFTSHYRR